MGKHAARDNQVSASGIHRTARISALRAGLTPRAPSDCVTAIARDAHRPRTAPTSLDQPRHVIGPWVEIRQAQGPSGDTVRR